MLGVSLNKSQENHDQTSEWKDVLETPDLLSWIEILVTTDNLEDVIKSDREHLHKLTTTEGQLLSWPSRRGLCLLHQC